MRATRLFSLLFLSLLALAVVLPLRLALPVSAGSAPAVAYSSLNVGCVQVSTSQCRLHVDPITIPGSAPSSLTAFQIRANDAVIYDFSTDVSNPPLGDYTPSTVKLDFGITCGAVYTLTAVAKDSASSDFALVGQAAPVHCEPVAIIPYHIWLPVVIR